MHLVQEINSGHFRQYDYGIARNMQVYGRPKPPDYDLTKVTVPISIIHGELDHIARLEVCANMCLVFRICSSSFFTISILNPQDTQALAKQLPNVIDFHTVPWKNWTHVDFNYAKDAGRLNHAHILDILNKYPF